MKAARRLTEPGAPDRRPPHRPRGLSAANGTRAAARSNSRTRSGEQTRHGGRAKGGIGGQEGGARPVRDPLCTAYHPPLRLRCFEGANKPGSGGRWAGIEGGRPQAADRNKTRPNARQRRAGRAGARPGPVGRAGTPYSRRAAGFCDDRPTAH